jgi:hypothetical protein
MLVTCGRTSLARSLYGVGGAAILVLPLPVLLLVASLPDAGWSLYDALGVSFCLLILAFPVTILWLLVEAATKPILLHVSPDGIRVESRAFLRQDLKISVDNIAGIYQGPIKFFGRMPTGHASLVVGVPRPNLSIRFRELTEIECAKAFVGRFWRIALYKSPEPLFFEIPRRCKKYRGLLFVCPDAEEVAPRMAKLLGVDTWSIF